MLVPWQPDATQLHQLVIQACWVTYWHVLQYSCTAFDTLVCCLQGEHGTGRNVAPFVEMEWGSKAYDLMWELKALFDPNFVLNPGVVLNKVNLAQPCLMSPTWQPRFALCLRL